MRKPYLFEATLAIVLIVLSTTMFLIVTASPAHVSGWEFQGSGVVQYMTVGENDTLYAFKSDSIYAIDNEGSLIWSYTVPEQWNIINSWQRPAYASDQSGTVESYPVADASSGYLYVLALPDFTLDSLKIQYYQASGPYVYLDAAVLAISPEGRLAWQLPLKIKINANDIIGLTDLKGFGMKQNIALRSDGSHLYVFNDNTETVIDRNGTALFTIGGVARPASVDEDGNFYLMRTPQFDAPNTIRIEAYDASGEKLWDREIQGTVATQYVADDLWAQYNCLPMYQNGTLYVPLTKGIVALDLMGRTMWWRYLPGDSNTLFDLMPIDSAGNIYIRQPNPGSTTSSIYVIGPDGMTRTAPWQYDSKYGSLVHTAAKDGIVYNVDRATFGTMSSVFSLGTEKITAYSVSTGTALWSYTLPVTNKQTVTLNESNVYDIFRGQSGGFDLLKAGDYYSQYSYPFEYTYPMTGASYNDVAFTPVGWPDISIYPGSDVVYVSFRSTTYESPIILNRSRAVYSSGIYALGLDGRLVWEKQLSAPVTSATANNSTIYYSTGDGKIFGTSVNGVVVGIALLSSLAIFFKFFVFGTVSRARDRLDKNDNRNMVLSYIAGNPGVTAVDIARDMSLNVGTVRYHLLILTINHKIVEHKDDKYLRYFTNSNSYSMEERAVVSLMKREPMWRVLNTLAEKPGLSNVEISRELNISTGAASRHMNELLSKGVVTKVPQADRGYAYSIKEEYRHYVTKMMDRL
ncbi:MAG: MarR family protein [Methanocella sp. PtaU1.Bin125]|nr:MAG: MarR family protein [Methanocella sp. PtaU1.Bin125]